MNYTEDKCFFIRLSAPYDTLQFQFVPQKMSFKRNIKLAQLEIVGRNLPKYHYTGGEKTLSFSLDFYSHSKDDIITKIRWLESLTYNDGINGKPAEKISIVFGDLFSDEQRWIITSLEYDLTNFRPLDDFLPVSANVNINLALDNSKDVTKSEIFER